MLFLKQTQTEISCHPEAIGYKVLNYVVRYLLEQYILNNDLDKWAKCLGMYEKPMLRKDDNRLYGTLRAIAR